MMYKLDLFGIIIPPHYVRIQKVRNAYKRCAIYHARLHRLQRVAYAVR